MSVLFQRLCVIGLALSGCLLVYGFLCFICYVGVCVMRLMLLCVCSCGRLLVGWLVDGCRVCLLAWWIVVWLDGFVRLFVGLTRKDNPSHTK